MASELTGDAGGGRQKTTKVNYPSNSKISKAEASEEPAESKKVIESVVSGTARQQKKSLGRQITETFAGDDARSVGHYVLFEVIIPATKNILYDAGSQGFERLLFGESRGSVSVSRRSSGTSYNSLSKDRRPDRRDLSYKSRANHDFDEIVIDTRGEAEQVVERLGDLIREYDVATVADLFSLTDVSSHPIYNKWGWTDIRGTQIRRARGGGYLIDLPKPEPIN